MNYEPKWILEARDGNLTEALSHYGLKELKKITERFCVQADVLAEHVQKTKLLCHLLSGCKYVRI
jgi:hypothetical protein